MRYLSLLAALAACYYQPAANAVTPCRIDGKIIYTRECMQQQARVPDELHQRQLSAIDATGNDGPQQLPASSAALAAENNHAACATSTLFASVTQNNAAALKACVDRNQLGNAINAKGRTLLHEAAAKGYVEAAGYLLSMRLPLERRSRKDRGATPLHLAAANGHPNLIRLLHEAGADLEARDYLRRTPLHLASGNGAAKTVQLLIRLRADVQSTDRANRTPLLVASQQPNNRAMLKSLLDAGADINHRTNKAMTALHYAVVTDTAGTELLLSRGIGLNNRNHLGQTPLLYAVSNDVDNHWARIKLVVEAGADLNAADDNQQTLLKIAYRKQHEPLLKLLLKHGVDTRNVATFIRSLQDSQPLL